MANFTIYSDGACKKNPGPGGWGTIIRDNKSKEEKEFSGFVPHTTNNRMELMGVINGFMNLGETGSDILVVTDSQYVVNAFQKGWLLAWERFGWKRKDKTDTINKDLWIELLSLVRKQKNVEFQWVRGHSGHIENERCDLLANFAISEHQT